jgi:hypothetical protein
MSLRDYPRFIISGLLAFCGGVDVALPFMLDLMRIPADMYQLCVVTGIVNGRTATLLAAMNLLVFTLLVVSSLTGYLKINWHKAVDIVIGGIPVTTQHLRTISFAPPYMDVTAAFAVPDHSRHLFTELETLRQISGLTLAVVKSHITQELFNLLVQGFPNASVVEIESRDEFFNDTAGFYDGLLTSAEGGSALTLLYPSFSVVVPRPSTTAVPIAPGGETFSEYFRTWIEIKKKSNSFQRYYDHWIRCVTPESEKAPRWSVIRNVLGWVE